MLQALHSKGVTGQAATTRTAELLLDVIREVAPDLANDLIARSGQYAADSAEYARGFVERLRTHWGDALDLVWGAIAATEEASRRCIQRNRARVREEQDWLFDALVQLNGQSIRVAREIHTLLTAGYPLGALALSRTMYEIAVRTTVLAEYGRQPEHSDLAERFVEHARVIEHRDLVALQTHAGKLGYETISADVVEAARLKRKAAIDRFGPDFKQPYGWAIGLPGVTTGRDLSQLESLAELAHRRPIYQHSSHLVHADARSLQLARVERGGMSSVLTNATNAGLGDAADHAMYALHVTYTNLTRTGEPVAPIDLYQGVVIRLLIERAQQLLARAEESVAESEDRLQQELAVKGQRMTPFGVTSLDRR